MIVDYEKMKYDALLEGNHALVTGGLGEIGRAVAELFAKQGALVIVLDEKAEDKAFMDSIRALSPKSFYVRCDLTDTCAASEALKGCIEQAEYIDVLVNNAGAFEGKLLHEEDFADLQKMLDANLKSAVLCTKAVIPSMMQRRHGNIVSITSDYATHAVPGVSYYAAAKAGLQAFTRAVGMDYCKFDIRANCVMPGYNVTTMGEKLIEDVGAERADEHFRYGQPLQRHGTAEDVAGVALYLASQMSRFVTGEAIPVNGGVQAVAHKQYLSHPLKEIK